MAYLISQLCIDCLDTACVAACPVKCIYELTEAPTPSRPQMLYIHPEECISCGACEPECPWEAIYEEFELPEALSQARALNALLLQEPAAFRVASTSQSDDEGGDRPARPTAADLDSNRRRWERTP